jgi:predicted O-linked N-acetylglucosamine transferase (SPINDLY family)
MPQSHKANSIDVPQTLAQALALHEKGRLGEAEKLYAAILAARPEHFDALQMMGLVKLATGQATEALRLVSDAMRLRAPSPQILLNYGMVLHELRRHQDALDSFDRAIKLKSKFAEAHNNRGAVLAAMGHDEEALESYRKAISIKPAYVEAIYNLGTSLRTLTQYDEAIKAFDRALALQPNYFKAYNNRGAVLEAQQKLEPALADYERAIALHPAFAEAHTNRSRVLCLLSRFDDALSSFAQMLEVRPDDARAHYNRGQILSELNRTDEAAAEYAKAVAIQPDFAEARFAECVGTLPILYADEAEIGRRRANYEQKLRALCDDVEAGRLTGDLVKAVIAKMPFLLAYQGQCDRALQEIYGRLVSHVMAQRYPAPVELAPPPLPGEPIRVGIVSSFFCLHSNWKIPIKGWVGQLDRSRFKLFGYHTGSRHDAETDAAAAMCDRFVHRTLDSDGWRREILTDAPHVLIYPGLLMDTVSLVLAAQRLARVQVTSWGHPETSGLATLDYYLSSDAMEPPGADAHYTERLVRLPNLSIYYEPVPHDPVVVTRAELGLRPDAAAFWCGQSLYKYLPQHDYVFAEIAKRAPNSQFVFLRFDGGPPVNALFNERLERAFAAAGLKAADHCVFLKRLTQSKFIAAIGQCDMFLDSIGWSGCNSALESLPHHLPIVTTPGSLMRGRHSAAILQMMGVTETVGATIDEYIAIAARLANHPLERQGISLKMQIQAQRIYRDRACIAALEQFLDSAVRTVPQAPAGSAKSAA